MPLLPYSLARPFLFGLDAETAHELTMHSLARLQGTPLEWAYCSGMVQDPVATAASNNPLLTTLVTAVGTIDGLADTLNGAEALTVFAPFNGAFEEIPPADLNALLEEGAKKGQKSTLYQVLAHHVVGASADTDAVVGDQETLAGDQLTIEGDENGMTVTDGTVTANVLCGNIPTANATVYVIDKVLTGVK